MEEKKKKLSAEETIEYLLKWKMETLQQIEERLEKEAENESGLKEIVKSFTAGVTSVQPEGEFKSVTMAILKSVFNNLDKVKAMEKYKDAPEEVDEWDKSNLTTVAGLFYRQEKGGERKLINDWNKMDLSGLSEDSVADFEEFKASVQILGNILEGVEEDPDFARHEVVDDIIQKLASSCKRCLSKNADNKKFGKSKIGEELKAIDKSLEYVITSNNNKKAIDDLEFEENADENIEKVSALCDNEYHLSKECLTGIFSNINGCTKEDFKHIQGADIFFDVIESIQTKYVGKQGALSDKDKLELIMQPLAKINGCRGELDDYFSKNGNLSEKEILLKEAFESAKKFTDFAFLNFANIEDRMTKRRETISLKKEKTNYKKLSKEAADEAKKNSPEANNKNVKKPEKELKEKELKEKDLDISTKKEIAELSGKKRK